MLRSPQQGARSLRIPHSNNTSAWPRSPGVSKRGVSPQIAQLNLVRSWRTLPQLRVETAIAQPELSTVRSEPSVVRITCGEGRPQNNVQHEDTCGCLGTLCKNGGHQVDTQLCAELATLVLECASHMLTRSRHLQQGTASRVPPQCGTLLPRQLEERIQALVNQHRSEIERLARGVRNPSDHTSSTGMPLQKEFSGRTASQAESRGSEPELCLEEEAYQDMEAREARKMDTELSNAVKQREQLQAMALQVRSYVKAARAAEECAIQDCAQSENRLVSELARAEKASCTAALEEEVYGSVRTEHETCSSELLCERRRAHELAAELGIAEESRCEAFATTASLYCKPASGIEVEKRAIRYTSVQAPPATARGRCRYYPVTLPFHCNLPMALAHADGTAEKLQRAWPG